MLNNITLFLVTLMFSSAAIASDQHLLFSDWSFDPVVKQRIGSSTVRIQLLDGSFFSREVSGNCTGTWISNTGYILTAAHCFNGNAALSRIWKMDPMDYAGRLKEMSSHTYEFVVTTLSSDGEEVSENRAAKIVSMGYPSYDHSSDMEKLEAKLKDNPSKDLNLLQLVQAGYGGRGDWVILKISGITPEACLAISTENPNLDQDYFSLGFPGMGYFDYNDTRRLYVSYGKFDSKRFEIDGRNWAADKARYGLNGIDNLWPFKIIAAPGMSGGPIVNPEGQLIGTLIGLASNLYINPMNNILDGLSFTKSLNPSIPEVKEIFSCHQ